MNESIWDCDGELVVDVDKADDELDDDADEQIDDEVDDEEEDMDDDFCCCSWELAC